MEILLLIFRLGLCAVFGAAALAKLADPEGTRRALASFGLPRGATKPLGRALPFAELAVAVALIPLASARWAALGALALLLIFTAAIGLSLARGNAPDCHCFGQLHSAPAGPSVLVRNLILAGAGGLIVWRGGGGLSATDWLFGLTPAERAQVILGLLSVFLLAAITALLVRILKRQGEMLERLEDLELSLERSESGAAVTRGDVAPLTAGLPVGAPAPEFILPSLDGAEVSLDALLAAGRPLLLLFVSPGCGPCASLLPEIKSWQRKHVDTLSVALVSRDTPEANRRKFVGLDPRRVLLQSESEVASEYQARWTPGGVVVTPGGTIGSQLAFGVEAIRSLAAHAVSDARSKPWLAAIDRQNGHSHQNGETARPSVGDLAPPFKLSDLSGQSVTLEKFRGAKLMLLFWSPECGFCKNMLEELRRVEAAPPKNAPALLVVSSGTVEANRAMNLTSPVLLDKDFGTGHAYGATGTPSAVLIDDEGRIASTVATGAQDVLALFGVRRVEAASAGS